MLVLSRKLSQKIILNTSDGDITLVIVGITGNQVRLGMEAPKSVSIRRSELADRTEKVA